MRSVALHWLRCAAVVGLLAVPGCGGDDDAVQDPDGFVDSAWMAERSEEFLAYASGGIVPWNILNVTSHIERERREPGWISPLRPLAADAWDAEFAQLYDLDDNRDFDALNLIVYLIRYADSDLVPSELKERAARAILDCKFWYTDPTPAGLIDNSYYWTENHQIAYHVAEYLAGQLFPDRVFSIAGILGEEHRRRASERIHRWIDLRARFGFSEWQSNVYYQKDIVALLALAEWADDDRLATRAAMVLDLILLDLALHTREAVLAVPHARTEKDDLTDGRGEATYGTVRFLFEGTDESYRFQHPDTTLFSIAQRYRIPEVIRQIGLSRRRFVSKTAHGIEIPEDDIGSVDDAPAGLAFDDPADLPVWWGMGALTSAPIVPLTIATMNALHLWETDQFRPFRGLRPLAADVDTAQGLAAAIAPQLNERVLQRGHSYAYRSEAFLMGTVQDYRKGRRSSQTQSWRASLGLRATVFTTHPASLPIESSDWLRDRLPGYWTGGGSLPRSAQFESVGIHIYDPLYPATSPPPLDIFEWLPQTHAYFPQDAFEEVRQFAGWTVGRLGDGAIALYSHRPTEWVAYDPEVVSTNGMTEPFDLVARGGADNVWIVECAVLSDWPDGFEGFVAALAAATVDVEMRPFETTVRYDSPSQGMVEFGWEGPLRVAGAEIPLRHGRMENPFAEVSDDGQLFDIAYEGWQLHLDFSADRRTVSVDR